MTESRQEGEEDSYVPVPRRDTIPRVRFSDIEDEESPSGSAGRTPGWRIRRRIIAALVIPVGLGLAVWAGYDVYRYLEVIDPKERPSQWVRYLLDAFLVVASLGGVRYVWRWARQSDPRSFT